MGKGLFIKYIVTSIVTTPFIQYLLYTVSFSVASQQKSLNLVLSKTASCHCIVVEGQTDRQSVVYVDTQDTGILT